MSRFRRTQAAYQRLRAAGFGGDAANWLARWAPCPTVSPPREPTRPPLLPAIASEVLVRLREPRRWRLALSSDHWLWRP